ncbi:uncharacterized protein PpBr36_11306 [Pyricularia pennisetigena]|uniref:uncharacterized protein n=1 Tax=Pyricularia pennisetigena TaxID=1578925 RepID=UPI00114F006E|nr:uncharacterized protein PpBr36_11306 [Pyricularia pennisetigena]TLS20572.1 hypothetical protein PpBr36_11306 [Pyricularia pennisetigena]
MNRTETQPLTDSEPVATLVERWSLSRSQPPRYQNRTKDDRELLEDLIELAEEADEAEKGKERVRETVHQVQKHQNATSKRAQQTWQFAMQTKPTTYMYRYATISFGLHPSKMCKVIIAATTNQWFGSSHAMASHQLLALFLCRRYELFRLGDDSPPAFRPTAIPGCVPVQRFVRDGQFGLSIKLIFGLLLETIKDAESAIDTPLASLDRPDPATPRGGRFTKPTAWPTALAAAAAAAAGGSRFRWPPAVRMYASYTQESIMGTWPTPSAVESIWSL